MFGLEDAPAVIEVEPPEVLDPGVEVTATLEPRRVVEMEPDQLLYLTLALLTNEVHYPVYRITTRIQAVSTNAINGPTDLQSVQSITRSVLLKEGQHLSLYLRLWSVISMVLLTLAYLYWALIEITSTKGYGWLTSLPATSEGLILISLVAVSSLVSLVQKLGSYGWRRSRRQLSVWLSLNPSKRVWRGAVPSRGEYATRNKGRFWLKWQVVSVICTLSTGVSLTLPFLLG
jgi:hypothetical protein